jgi:cysteine sulfinate desulfinase/cysteine desulfurase-like protein
VRAHGSLRVTFGPETTESDVDVLLAALERVLPRLRALAPRPVVATA